MLISKNKSLGLLLAILVLSGALICGCPELFPPPKGRINPNDPYAPARDLSISPQNADEMSIRFRLADFNAWPEDMKKSAPNFFVVKVGRDNLPSDIGDGVIIKVFRPDNLSPSELDYEGYCNFLFEASQIPDSSGGINGFYAAAIFWTEEYLDGMDKLNDEYMKPGNFDYQAAWYGPITGNFNGGVAEAADFGGVSFNEASSLYSKYFNANSAALINSASDVSYILARFRRDFRQEVKSARLFLALDSVSAAGSIKLYVYDTPWSQGDNAETLWNGANNFFLKPEKILCGQSQNFDAGNFTQGYISLDAGNAIDYWENNSTDSGFFLTCDGGFNLFGTASEMPPLFYWEY